MADKYKQLSKLVQWRSDKKSCILKTCLLKMQYTLHKIHDFLMGHFSQFIVQIFMQKSILLRSKKFENYSKFLRLLGWWLLASLNIPKKIAKKSREIKKSNFSGNFFFFSFEFLALSLYIICKQRFEITQKNYFFYFSLQKSTNSRWRPRNDIQKLRPNCRLWNVVQFPNGHFNAHF